MTVALRPRQGIGEQSTTGVELNPLEINEIGSRSQGLLEQRLPRCTTQKGRGLQRQGREQQRSQQSDGAAVAGRCKVRQIRTGTDQLINGLTITEMESDAGLQKRQPQHQPLQRLCRSGSQNQATQKSSQSGPETRHQAAIAGISAGCCSKTRAR